MMSSTAASTSSLPPVLGPDNRCCFCLTLRTGSIIVGIVNALVNALGFGWYTTSPSVQSSWSHPTPITDLDISVFAVFALQIIVDILLIYGAVKKIHSQTVPWLCANSVVMGIMLVLVALLLFFGYVQMALAYDEYVSVLSLIGCLAAGHLFSCLVVFQFRKNLMEERAIFNAVQQVEETEMPQNYVRPPSPPPTYEEVAKTVVAALPGRDEDLGEDQEGVGGGSDAHPHLGKDAAYSAFHQQQQQQQGLFDHDFDSESPPEYAMAVAALKEMEEKEKDERDDEQGEEDCDGSLPPASATGSSAMLPTLTLKLQEVSNNISYTNDDKTPTSQIADKDEDGSFYLDIRDCQTPNPQNKEENATDC